MTSFLIDEMFPVTAAELLRDTYRRDAVHVAEVGVALVFVLKKNLPAGGGQAAVLAKVLDRWAQESPDPYLGHHWPRTD